MQKKNYYAVKQGRVTGIYKTWDECKAQVQGFSGASYKGFVTLKEAEDFLALGKPIEKKAEGQTAEKETFSEVTAYVDGSYDDELKMFSYGAVIFYNGEQKHFSKRFNSPELVAMRNVAGEIKGAECAMQFCIDNNANSVDLYHDYEGIAKWCTGEWRANKDGTKLYKQFYDGIKDRLKVNFIKVAAHSGDEYNDLADALAKKALRSVLIGESTD